LSLESIPPAKLLITAKIITVGMLSKNVFLKSPLARYFKECTKSKVKKRHKTYDKTVKIFLKKISIITINTYVAETIMSFSVDIIGYTITSGSMPFLYDEKATKGAKKKIEIHVGIIMESNAIIIKINSDMSLLDPKKKDTL